MRSISEFSDLTIAMALVDGYLVQPPIYDLTIQRFNDLPPSCSAGAI